MSDRLRQILGWLRVEEGSGAVEMALSCTVLVAMLMGMFEMTLGIYAGHYTSDAARQATRYAMVRGSNSCANTPNLSNCGATAAEIQTWVRSLSYPGIVTSSVTVTTTWYTASTTEPTHGNTTTWTKCTTGTCNIPGNLVKIAVNYPLTFSIPFSKSISLNLTSTSQVVIAQ